MSTRMVRKQIYITRRQDEWLKRQSIFRGISEAELVRLAIDEQLPTSSDQKTQENQPDWERAIDFMKSLRSRRDQFSEPYIWNRNEIYEERENRYMVRDDNSKSSTK